MLKTNIFFNIVFLHCLFHINLYTPANKHVMKTRANINIIRLFKKNKKHSVLCIFIYRVRIVALW